ncbi:MAG: TonB-dependent receptor [Gemmatimonadota bacterium]|nr:TonB-dependent receptor [Gemmatimonadota bacterium]
MKIPRWALTLPIVLALAAGAATLPAQVTTGSIAGTVTGPQGALEGAQVTVRSTATGFVRTTTTQADGRYLVAGLETGTYQVQTRRLGFAPQTRPAVVTLGQTTRIDFTLSSQPTQLSAVTVTAASETGLISPTRTGVLTTISDSSLRRLPSLDRNFTDFVALTPQVSTTLPNGGLSGGGVNNRYNQVQIDGTNETDLFGLGSTGQPGGQANGRSIGIESVKEYQVLLAPFDVRQGNFAGLLINAVTKSGTNALHGTAYYYGRNQSLTRSQDYINDFSKYQYGVAVGGPLVKDKALFFINPEWTTYHTPATGVYVGGPNANFNPADVSAVQQALQGYGMTAGNGGAVTLQNPLSNVFARLDFPDLPYNSSLVLRYNYGHAVDGALSRGASGTNPNLALTSNQYQYASTKHAPALEFRTNFANGAYNELLASYTRVRDPRTAANGLKQPQVSVMIPGATVIAGTERYSQGNEVDQDIVELTDNLTLPFGSHTVVLGTQNEFYKARNLFAQASYGVWTFDSLDSLRNGTPYQYIVGVPAVGDGSVRFRTSTLAAYVQDQWTVNPQFTLTYGIRADMPTFANKPPTNQDVLSEYGRDTHNIPSGHIQWSPRVGFNWDVTGDQRNQLRGGIGAFVGHPAYVWMSNAFQNSGLSGVPLLTCRGAAAPQFTSATVASAPQQCANGVTASAGGEIDLLQSSLRMPQTLRGSIGYDHDLGHNLIGTIEGLYTKALYAPFYYNLALGGPIGTDAHGRVMYGPRPYAPVLRGARSTVLDVANESKDHYYNITGKLTRRFMNHWEGSFAYTYSRGWDVQSLTSSTAYSQYRYGRIWAGNQMDMTATRSAFEQRHRIVAQGSYTFPSRTTLSMIYTGGSGIPYAFVYNSDLNGNGFSYDDPIYVPKDATNPSEIQFDGNAASQAQQAAAFNQFIDSHKCLRDQRGQIMARNSCTAPWSNMVNLSLRQSFRTPRMQNISLQLDVVNFMNLLNKRWGRQAFTYSEVSVLSYKSMTNGTDLSKGAVPVFHFYSNPTVFNYNNLASNYQMQLSLRYSF